MDTNPEKPKRITLTMANTMFGAFSGVRPVNWGLIIHEIVTWAIPYIGRNPLISPPSSCTSTRTTDAPPLMRMIC